MINEKLVYIAIAATLSLTAIGCAPEAKLESQKNKKNNATIEHEYKSTTHDFENLSQEQLEQYEKPIEIIRNGKNSIYTGYTKLKNIKSTYNRSQRLLEISGTVNLYKANNKEIAVTQDFKLIGQHDSNSTVFALKPIVLTDEKSQELRIRGKVTCLGHDEDGTIDCAEGIVDLFIRNENNYFTEQIEIFAPVKKKSTSESSAEAAQNANLENPTEITPENRPVEPIEEISAEEAVEKNIESTYLPVQSEGTEDSLPGRYEGTAATVDLNQLFDIQSSEEIEITEPTSAENESTNTALEHFEQTATGELVLKNQAYGFPHKGKLRNASSLKLQQQNHKQFDLYYIAEVKPHYYGTQEMMDMVVAMGKKMQQIYSNKVYVSRISAKYGGYLPPSKSHQNGMDSDIGYPTVSGKTMFPIVVTSKSKSINRRDYSVEKTFELFKYLVAQQQTPVARIFTDNAIIQDLCSYAKKNGQISGDQKEVVRKVFETLQHVDGHGDHFHLRLKCTANQKECRNLIYQKSRRCS